MLCFELILLVTCVIVRYGDITLMRNGNGIFFAYVCLCPAIERGFCRSARTEVTVVGVGQIVINCCRLSYDDGRLSLPMSLNLSNE